MGYFDAIDALHRELMLPATADVTEPPRTGETDEELKRRIAREGVIHTITHGVYEAAQGHSNRIHIASPLSSAANSYSGAQDSASAAERSQQRNVKEQKLR
ncbi:hypothetical protein COU80_02595 [Candidatus Peregrinibacteria bacterium CG10_big_fil_rev_8_21_14_0_10_55_24]|nr:MAG: hypothetical protein COU80_02595 [Candidatus Peregrinibacteria bacterium CG10_big_fil_rev_8_21_14_0_10_55_24]